MIKDLQIFIAIAFVVIVLIGVVLSIIPTRYEETAVIIKLVEYHRGGLAEANTALFDDGRVVIDPRFRGDIFIGGSYRKIRRYNVLGFEQQELWRLENGF